MLRRAWNTSWQLGEKVLSRLALVSMAALACSANSDSTSKTTAAVYANPARGHDAKQPLDFPHVVLGNYAGNWGSEPGPTPGSLPADSGVKDGVYYYNVPLKLPDGVAGLKPDLALSYSSAAGNGVMGVGWSISGTSAITRCAHNVARDGFAFGFDFSDDFTNALNQYCLGDNKLVPIERSGSIVTYQTEHADFSHIEAHWESSTRDPDYFTARGADGRIYSYGGFDSPGSPTHSGRASGPHGGVGKDPGEGLWTYAWHLSRVEDRDGNAIQYLYVSDAGSGYAQDNTPEDLRMSAQNRYLSGVSYGNTTLRFIYDATPRADRPETYSNGFDLSVTQRLQKITIDTAGEQGAPTWTYSFTYDVSTLTGRSLLTQIALDDQFGARLSPTTFLWNAAPEGFRPTQSSAYGMSSYTVGGSRCAGGDLSRCLPLSYTRVMLADLDGDGRDDVLYSIGTSSDGAIPIVRIAGTNGLSPETQITSGPCVDEGTHMEDWVAADFDGDGKSEIICPFANQSNKATTAGVARWNGSSLVDVGACGLKTLFTPPVAECGTTSASCNEGGCFDCQNGRIQAPPLNGFGGRPMVRVADFNGDGILDILGDGLIYLGKRSTASSPLAFATMPIAGPPGEYGPPTFTTSTTPMTENEFGLMVKAQSPRIQFTGDMNGDGRADVVKVEAERKGLLFADMNGDGIADEVDFSEMQGRVDCDCAGNGCGLSGHASFGFTIKKNFGRRIYDGATTWPAPRNFNYDTTVPAAAFCNKQGSWGGDRDSEPEYADSTKYPWGPWPAEGRVSRTPLGEDYAGSIRIADFNADGRADILQLNAAIDDGVRLSLGPMSVVTADRASCGRNDVCYFQRHRRDPYRAGHRSAPILWMQSAAGHFTAVVLPVSGARLREERYFRNELWRGSLDQVDLAQPELPGGGEWGLWRSHYWNATAVGDINGDGLADVVQLAMAQDGGSVTLETITARYQRVLSSRADVIFRVTDGLRQNATPAGTWTERVGYLGLPALKSLGRYSTPDASCSPAQTSTRCRSRGMVASYWIPPGSGARIDYDYEAARIDPRGRGSLGFAAVTARDTNLGTETTWRKTLSSTELPISNDFGVSTYARRKLVPVGDAYSPIYLSWDAGASTKSKVYWLETVSSTTVQSSLLTATPEPGPLRRVSTSVTNELTDNIANGRGNTYFVRPLNRKTFESNIAVANDPTGVSSTVDVQTTVDYVDYDTLSCPREVTTKVFPGNGSSGTGGSTEVVTTTYDHDMANWFVRRPNHIERRRVKGETNITRTTDLAYWPGGGPNPGRLKQTIEAKGQGGDYERTTNYSYYPNGPVQKIEVKGVDSAITSSPQTRTTSYTYDRTGIYPSTVTNAAGQVTTLTYDPELGELIASVDPNGIGVDYIYDGFGRLRGELPDGQAATMTVLSVGNPGREDAPFASQPAYRLDVYRGFGSQNSDCLGGLGTVFGHCFLTPQSQVVVDVQGRKVVSATRSADYNASYGATFWDTTYTYDMRGRLYTQTQPKQRTSVVPATQTVYLYDALDRPTSVVNPGDGATRTWSYPSRFSVTLTDERNGETKIRYDVDGQAVTHEEKLGTSYVKTVLDRDAFGQVLTSTRTDTGGGAPRQTTYTYDSLGRKTTSDDPETGKLIYKYNAFGELRWQEDTIRTEVFRHDSLGRITLARENGDLSKYQKYDWDTAPGSGIGRLASTFNGDGDSTQSYTYDALGRTTQRTMTTASQSYSVQMTYDAWGRLDKMYYPAPPGLPSSKQLVNKHEYDFDGNLQFVRRISPSAATYWELKKRTPVEAKEALESSGNATTYQRLFDAATGFLTDINITAPTTVRNLHYSYFPDGNIDTFTTTAGSETVTQSYVYDDLDRLITWKRSHTGDPSFRYEYAYNDFGDLRQVRKLSGRATLGSEDYTFDVTSPRTMPSAVSGYTKALSGQAPTSISYSYDRLGRRTEKKIGSTYESRYFNRWDLPYVVMDGPTTVATYRYDAFGRRVRKVVGTNETYYLDDLFEDRIVDGAHTFIHHIKAGNRVIATAQQPIAGSTAPISTRYLHHDAIGSLALINDPSGHQSFYYEPFGARVAPDGTTPAAVNALAHNDFAGAERDDFGLLNMRGRMYDPELRRFLSPDPIISRPAVSQGYARYAYVGNNPANRIDPSGLRPDDDLGGGGGQLCFLFFCLELGGSSSSGEQGNGGGGNGQGNSNRGSPGVGPYRPPSEPVPPRSQPNDVDVAYDFNDTAYLYTNEALGVTPIKEIGPYEKGYNDYMRNAAENGQRFMSVEEYGNQRRGDQSGMALVAGRSDPALEVPPSTGHPEPTVVRLGIGTSAYAGPGISMFVGAEFDPLNISNSLVIGGEGSIGFGLGQSLTFGQMSNGYPREGVSADLRIGGSLGPYQLRQGLLNPSSDNSPLRFTMRPSYSLGARASIDANARMWVRPATPFNSAADIVRTWLSGWGIPSWGLPF